MSTTTRLVRRDAIRRDIRRLESAALMGKIEPAQAVLIGIFHLVENICDAIELHERDISVLLANVQLLLDTEIERGAE